ncbi:unnamed protein product [Calicophoron daubneyi]|uniref:J domain-containing protein n=1 Tax=Calicophoron daubneyi TaxID=300641 RepID=A0AAV2TF80_CALDB
MISALEELSDSEVKPFEILRNFALYLKKESDDLYDLLHVQKNASVDEITQSFRKLALLYHPDKNPDDVHAARKFSKINRAYLVLRDENMRRIYDSHGMIGVKIARLYGEEGVREYYKFDNGCSRCVFAVLFGLSCCCCCGHCYVKKDQPSGIPPSEISGVETQIASIPPPVVKQPKRVTFMTN